MVANVPRIKIFSGDAGAENPMRQLEEEVNKFIAEQDPLEVEIKQSLYRDRLVITVFYLPRQGESS